MSGICGVFHRDGAPVLSQSLAGMLEALRGFGSEAFCWAPETADAPVALGCRPMRVTPEDQHYVPPLRSADGRLVLVADARIDNRAELAAQLGMADPEARQLPDAAFILAAYLAWEMEAPRRLVGDFAFALWDERHRRLFCARDGMGSRVLFHHLSSRRLAFASAPYALIALKDVRARLNEQRIAEALVLYQDHESTFFSGINRLRPGHTLTATGDGIRIERFWAPGPGPEIRFRTDRQYVEGFSQVFDRAVSDRLRSIGPVGIMLSGGLDSTSVAVSAASQLQSRSRSLLAFHAAPRAGFGAGDRPGWVADESAEVEAVAGCFENLDLWTYRTDGRTSFSSDLKLFEMAGLPPRNPGNLAWFEAVHAAARDQGVRVLLNGNYGNSTISYDGIRSLRDMARSGHWAYVWREVRAMARQKGQRPRDIFRNQVLLPLLPTWLVAGYYPVQTREEAARLIATWSAIQPDFARAHRVEERVLANGVDGVRARRAGGLERRVMELNSPADLPDLSNGFRPWFGIETREPAIDRRVIEYCLSVPGSQYLRNGNSKWLLRRAMRGQVPDQVLDRRTRGSQSADWTELIPAMLGDMATELDRLERSEMARQCLDLGRMRSLVVNCPHPLRPEDRTAYVHLLHRGITMGRFIRWFEATYP